MEDNTLNILGSFYDHPNRILSYSSIASSLGATPRFISNINDLDYCSQTPEQFLFTDETTIRESYTLLLEMKNHQSLENKLHNIMKMSDKFHARQITNQAFPHEYFVIKSMEEINSIHPLKGGWVCKPRWGSNSRDVQEISSSCGLREAVKPILDRDNHALIEQFIDGSHMCIDFAWTGCDLALIGYCEKRMTSFGRKIVEAFHTLGENVKEQCEVARRSLLPVLIEHFSGIRFTIHGEYILDRSTGDLKLAELNPRAPWGILPELFSIGNGINFDQAVLANALGQKVPTVSRQQPTVLGSVYAEEFFSKYESIPNRGNTLFVERFDDPAADKEKQGKLIKFGRFLLWGRSREAVQLEWDDLSALALPNDVRAASPLDTTETWKSKCC